jgi:hypothetical protein
MRYPICIVAALFAVALLSLSSHTASATSFQIWFDLEGANLSPGEEAVFAQAANYWDHIIKGYATGITDMYGIGVSVSNKYIDGVGGILGSTSIGALSWCTASNGVTYTLSRYATMSFDSADLDNMYNQGYLYPVIVHETAHALGFGALWSDNGLYVAGSGEYTGIAGRAAYRAEFVGQQSAACVPVELGGGDGTANAHWNENETFHLYDPAHPELGGYYTTAPTGIVDAQGRDMQYEIMDGWMETYNISSIFVSQTTIHSFEDLGYKVVKLPGDADNNGTVNGADLNTVLSNYNRTGMVWSQGDFDGNTTVNGADLNTVLSHYNQNLSLYGTFGPGGGSSLTAAVPEPGTLSLLLGVAAGLLVWYARKRSSQAAGA